MTSQAAILGRVAGDGEDGAQEEDAAEIGSREVLGEVHCGVAAEGGERLAGRVEESECERAESAGVIEARHPDFDRTGSADGLGRGHGGGSGRDGDGLLRGEGSELHGEGEDAGGGAGLEGQGGLGIAGRNGEGDGAPAIGEGDRGVGGLRVGRSRERDGGGCRAGGLSGCVVADDESALLRAGGRGLYMVSGAGAAGSMAVPASG